MRHRDTPFLIMALAGGVLAGCWPSPLRPPVPTGSAGPAAAAAREGDGPPLALAPPARSSPYQARPAEPRPLPPAPEPPAPPPTPEPPVRPAGLVRPAGEPLAFAKPAPRRDPPVVEALRCLLDRRPSEAVVPLEKLDKPTQDLLLRFLPLIARLSEGGLEQSDPEELALVTGQLEEVIRALRPRAALVVDKMCFCRRIDQFGQYDPLPADYRFKPGEMVQVYVELQNFSTRLVAGLYETRLASQVEIQDAQQRVLWRQDFNDRDRPHQSRSLRNDYFNSYRFCIPENIPPGSYRLVVRVSDVHLPERRPAERSLVLRLTTRPAGGGPLAESGAAR